jgi:hypothetical protein
VPSERDRSHRRAMAAGARAGDARKALLRSDRRAPARSGLPHLRRDAHPPPPTGHRASRPDLSARVRALAAAPPSRQARGTRRASSVDPYPLVRQHSSARRSRARRPACLISSHGRDYRSRRDRPRQTHGHLQTAESRRTHRARSAPRGATRENCAMPLRRARTNRTREHDHAAPRKAPARGT